MSAPNTATDSATDAQATDRPVKGSRLWLLDALRGVALIAMAIYHFSWDLEYFGYIDPGTVGTGGWKMFARMIAGSFLFLAGFSLVLGHFPTLKVRPFAIRFLRIAAAAAAITVATWFMFPDSFIFFGILHSIAAASLIGLIFLRLPAVVAFIAAAAAFAAPFYLRSPVFDAPTLLWIGLSQTLPRSNDYVPLLPWLSPFLTGLGVARLMLAGGKMHWLTVGGQPPSIWKSALATGGRHSLAFYLIHQPVLFAVVYGVAMVFPAAKPDPVEGFRNNCVASCTQQEGATLCSSFCDCTLDQLMSQDLFEALNAGQIDVKTDRRILDIAGQCTLDAQSKE